VSKKFSRENRTGHDVTNENVRSVHEVAAYTKVHLKHHVLIPAKVQYLATV
jgi:hypothetical protein